MFSHPMRQGNHHYTPGVLLTGPRGPDEPSPPLRDFDGPISRALSRSARRYSAIAFCH